MKLENEIQYDYEMNISETDVLLPYLCQYIHFSTSNGKNFQKNLWPSDTISLIFNFNKTKINNELCPNVVLVGLHEDIYTMQPDEKEIDTIIVHFSPIGFWAFSKKNTSSITNRIVDARAIFGDSINVLFSSLQLTKNTKERQNMLESFFTFLLKNQKKPLSCFAELIKNIQSDPEYTIPETEISYRHLSRIFKQIVGVNLQTYRRLVRFENAKQLLIQQTDISLTDIGYQSGYFDQAHFAREFKKLTGLRAKYFAPRCFV